MRSSLMFPPQQLGEIEVWTLTWKCKCLDWICVFSCSDLLLRFRIDAPLRDPIVAQLKSLDRCPHNLVQSGVLNDLTEVSCGFKTNPSHHSSATTLDSCYEVFVEISVWFSPNMAVYMIHKHLQPGPTGYSSRTSLVCSDAVMLPCSFSRKGAFSSKACVKAIPVQIIQRKRTPSSYSIKVNDR